MHRAFIKPHFPVAILKIAGLGNFIFWKKRKSTFFLFLTKIVQYKTRLQKLANTVLVDSEGRHLLVCLFQLKSFFIASNTHLM